MRCSQHFPGTNREGASNPACRLVERTVDLGDEAGPGVLTKVLLDTQVILWSLANDDQLGKKARALINDAAVTKLVSSASIWEMEIKARLGRLEIVENLTTVLLASGVTPLPISWFHAQTAGGLPRHHGDPFDRMLIAQAQCDDLLLMSTDDEFSKYEVGLIDARK